MRQAALATSGVDIASTCKQAGPGAGLFTLFVDFMQAVGVLRDCNMIGGRDCLPLPGDLAWTSQLGVL